MKGDELYYGRRKPRKVILDEQTKSVILKQIHVDQTKGTNHLMILIHALKSLFSIF